MPTLSLCTVLSLLCISLAAAILLFPAYRSTDFDVHWHWKALAFHQSPAVRYTDTIATRHTLDYPPGFALWEALLAQFAPIDCLPLQDDIPDERLRLVSDTCLVYMRSTVLMGTILYWIVLYAMHRHKQVNLIQFSLLVLHPAWMWLDHVHFQYNALVAAVWMTSLYCIRRAMEKDKKESTNNDHWFLVSAVCFAATLTLKHLYLTLAPWYAVFLLQHYCVGPNLAMRLLVRRLSIVGVVTVVTLVLPCLPFLVDAHYHGDGILAFIKQLFRRLFPFGRGLVHEYWAGNVWAFYAAARRIVDLPTVSPTTSLVCVLLGQVPALIMAWRARTPNQAMLSLACAAGVAFSLGYHVHEKAILNMLLPLLLWNVRSKLTWECQVWGTVGLVPLLYERRECLLVLCSLALWVVALTTQVEIKSVATWKDRLVHGLPVWMHVVGVVLVVAVFEAPSSWWGRYEFVPLAVTSLACATHLTSALLRLHVVLIWGE